MSVFRKELPFANKNKSITERCKGANTSVKNIPDKGVSKFQGPVSDDFGRVSFSIVASAARRPQQAEGGTLEAKGFPGLDGDNSTESLGLYAIGRL